MENLFSGWGVFMKKIGIISMQRIINYGSFLQAYGLKNIIEKKYR